MLIITYSLHLKIIVSIKPNHESLLVTPNESSEFEMG